MTTETTGPARYRVKRAEVDALQWTGANITEMTAFAGAEFSYYPDADYGEEAGVLTSRYSSWETLIIGQWVLRGPHGLFVVGSQQFAEDYEPIAPGVDDPDPMPVFTLKGKDVLAAGTVDCYRRECLRHDLGDQAVEAGKAFEEMAAWKARHPELVKLPDHLHVPARAEGASS